MIDQENKTKNTFAKQGKKYPVWVREYENQFFPVLSYVLLNPRGQTNGQMDGQTADGLTEKPSAK